jgi:hypothetical protein
LDRHRVAAVVVAGLLLTTVGACGGSAASPPSASPSPTEAPVPTAAPSETSSQAPSATPALRTTATARCGGVALRKEAKTDAEVIVRAKAGTKVRVVEVVVGEPYVGGSCGESGDSWLKVDRVGGKPIKSQYGVPFGFVAAGFFK